MRDETKKQFGKQFFGAVGTIEGGDDTPVQMTSLGASWHCVAECSKGFGCKPNEQALLVEWIPAGMQWKLGEIPSEAGVDENEIPRVTQWVVFPKSFGDLPVYYKRGSMAFAC